MNRILAELRKEINWYRPAVLQVVELNLPAYDYLVSAGILKYGRICGIDWKISKTKKIKVLFEAPKRDVTDLLEILPAPHPKLLKECKLGLIAESLETTIKNPKTKISKEMMYCNLNSFYTALIEKYFPTKCVSSMVWGAPLAFLYNSAIKNISCLGIIPENRQNNPPKYWDCSSRNMYGYITTEFRLTELDHKGSDLHYQDTLRNVYVSCIDNSDVVVFQQTSPKNSLFNSLRNVAISKNKLIIDVSEQWRTFSETS